MVFHLCYYHYYCYYYHFWFIINKLGTVYKGSIFAIDPVTESVVLKDSNGGYTLLSPTQITKIEGDISNIPTPNINEFGLSVSTLNQQELKSKETSATCLAGKHD